MAVFTRYRGLPWLGGALWLVLAGGLVAAAVHALGSKRWPLHVGVAAGLLLAFGAVERLWHRRPSGRRRRVVGRGRLRVVEGGKDKGNGRAHDVSENGRTDDGDKPRWVM